MDPDTPRSTIAEFEQLLESHHPFASVLGIDILAIGAGKSVLRLPDSSSHPRLGGLVAGPMLLGSAALALYAALVGGTGHPHAVSANLRIQHGRACGRETECQTGKMWVVAGC